MIYISKFRTNDLSPSKGKQIEFNTSVVENFFEFKENECYAEFECHSLADLSLKMKIRVHLKLSPSRGDYKIYQNADGSMDLKDFFIDFLHLDSLENINDYFAIKKITNVKFVLYYVPRALLFSDFFAIVSGDQILFSEETTDTTNTNESASLQRIYYGAPGTGKSYKVKEIAERDQDHFVRTTFHPDSDYSTFVGCYKPSTMEMAMRDVTGKIIHENGKEVTETRIVYEFVPQAFLQAYIEAWKSYPTPEFLVIEEINRGNCAQIFGDLFQLLDRNENGFSDYYINADSDMRKYLSEEFAKFKDKFDEEKKAKINGGCKREVVNKIFTGEIMLIPSNLYIWATMNTSDQSLFPIDSAFKRRWDWVYVPIAKGVDRKSGEELKWKIVVGTKEYDWWSFLEKINEQIGATTNSEDKKLGFFFCQAKNDEIDAETFVSKVLFYLWNDVFKDYGFDGELFKAKDGNPLTFDKFYNVMRGEAVPNVDNVQLFLENLGVEGSTRNSTEDVDKEGDDGEVEQDSKDLTRYNINGEGKYPKRTLAWEIVNKYVREHAQETVAQVLLAFSAVKDLVSHGIETQAEHDARQDRSKDRVKAVECNGEKLYVATNGWGGREVMNRLIAFVNSQPWNMKVDEAQ